MRKRGEKMTWPENAWPFPDQWLEWFESLTPERKLEVAGVVCRNAQTAAECIGVNHAGTILSLLTAQEEQRRLLQVAAHRLVRMKNAWHSARRRAIYWRSGYDHSINHLREQFPASQSDPEALPKQHSDAPIAAMKRRGL
jgi:hypothetical protein